MLLVLVTGMCGYYPVFRLMQSGIWQEMEERVESAASSRLQEIAPSLGVEIEWTRVGKEFRYKGKMYDVVRAEMRNGKPVYLCLGDEKESSLFSLLDEAVNGQLDGKSDHSNSKSMLKVFFAEYYNKPSRALVIHLGTPEEITFDHSILSSLYVSKLDTPPPEHC
jgi:hypothetical protein